MVKRPAVYLTLANAARTASAAGAPFFTARHAARSGGVLIASGHGLSTTAASQTASNEAGYSALRKANDSRRRSTPEAYAAVRSRHRFR